MGTYPHFTSVDLNDGEWHRVAWSVYNENVQLWVDCNFVADLPMPRNMARRLSLGGVVVFGSQIGDSKLETFKGDIQSLILDSDPTSASFMCNGRNLTPNCDTAAAALTGEPESMHIGGHDTSKTTTTTTTTTTKTSSSSSSGASSAGGVHGASAGGA